jgi:hypothetical protein
MCFLIHNKHIMKYVYIWKGCKFALFITMGILLNVFYYSKHALIIKYILVLIIDIMSTPLRINQCVNNSYRNNKTNKKREIKY